MEEISEIQEKLPGIIEKLPEGKLKGQFIKLKRKVEKAEKVDKSEGATFANLLRLLYICFMYEYLRIRLEEGV